MLQSAICSDVLCAAVEVRLDYFLGELMQRDFAAYIGAVPELITIDDPKVVALCEQLAELMGVSIEDAIDEAVREKRQKLEALASSD